MYIGSPGPELDKLEREVANYERFQALVVEVAEVNEATCDAWPPSELSLAEVPATGPGNAASSVSSSLLCAH
ncbi:MAG: hypothetical protein M0008_01690 [Actinomycetota bacterium]|nr:hypothetical protein [Actinomycetota bacterium]